MRRLNIKNGKAREFLESDTGRRAYFALVAMVKDGTYNTTSTYSPSSEDGNLLFIDKHMTYLCSHLHVNADQYVSNLRLITKVRK